MNPIKKLKPKPGKEIPFLVLISFLGTFISSRLLAIFSPNLYLFTYKGDRVHHLAYGIILLSILNYILLIRIPSYKNRLRLALLYGIGLGMAFDEFIMWIQLEDTSYWNRLNFDIVIIISLIFLNIVYFDGFWRKWGYRLGSFFKGLITED